MGNIGDGTGFDLSMLAIGFADQDGGRRGAIGDGGDVHAYISMSNIHVKRNMHNYMLTICRRKCSWIHKDVLVIQGVGTDLPPPAAGEDPPDCCP